MSGYGKMHASPFWKKVMRITGILCFVTLMFPAVLYVKYFVFDRPTEMALASTAPANAAALPVDFRYTELFRARAVGAPEPSDRIQAIHYLESLARFPDAHILHNNECVLSELTIAQAARTDPDPTVKVAASEALANIASHGAIANR